MKFVIERFMTVRPGQKRLVGVQEKTTDLL